MGKIKVLSGAEACRILAENGFLNVRQRGSHIVMQKTIARHNYHRAGSQSSRIGSRNFAFHYPAITTSTRVVRD
jgi:hypothetical protein